MGTEKYTKEELDRLSEESTRRYEALVEEYKRTHKLPSRGVISTPEIEAERAEQKRLYSEYWKLKNEK